MALYDPDAAGNAAPYLRLDPVVLMEVRSAPFEGKTAVWVPYAETGYTRVRDCITTTWGRFNPDFIIINAFKAPSRSFEAI